MALVIPFKGIFYNQEKIGDFSRIVAPPYDVISEGEKTVLCGRHPQNVVRLILGEPGERSGDNSRFYNLAAERLQAWTGDGTLVADGAPAMYLTSVEFTVDDTRYQRYGFIAYVRLEPFENKVILPHERTSHKVKADRLNLLKATGSGLCQIFSLYNDPDQIIITALTKAVGKRPADIDLIDDTGEHHRLWRIDDSRVTGLVSRAFRDKKLYIADGHHRYETALNYRAWVKENAPSFSDTHASNYVMMSLSSTSDPGLIILPCHRLLLDGNQARFSEWTGPAADYFDIQEIPYAPNAGDKEVNRFKQLLRTDLKQNRIGAMVNGRPVFYLLTLRPHAMEEAFGNTIPEVLRSLDVTVLTQLVLKKILGYSQSELDEEEAIAYTSNFGRAVEAVLSGNCRAAFLLNPTRNEQVQDVAAQGEIMPRKSTFYYPKVLTGLVFSDQKQCRIPCNVV